MGRKKKGVPNRKTVYIPPALVERMAKEADVNWSAVACTAFEKKLDELTGQRIKENGVKSMNEVIERLRLSRQEMQSEMQSQGFKDGQDWASKVAEARDLIALERFKDSQSGRDWDAFMESDSNDAYSVAERLSMAISGDSMGRSECHDFWCCVYGEDWERDICNEAEYLNGFVDGALDIWSSVKDQI